MHHLIGAGYFLEAAMILSNPYWLERTLLKYGAAHVVRDFREYLQVGCLEGVCRG